MFNVKEAPWKVILVYLLASILLVSLINLVLFPGTYFDPITNATGGLINATLQANLLNLLLFGLIVFGWGRLRSFDVGLHWNKLPEGILLTALLWLGTQAIVLLVNAINGDIHLHPQWSERGVTAVLGGLIGQLLGNALFEEIGYRGFYLSQLHLKIKAQSESWKIAGAVLATLVLFILSHIPNRIFAGYTLADIPLDFALLFGWGLFFTAVYLISGNLFLAIGIHALGNQPTLITEPTFPPQILLFLLTCILLAALKAIRRRKSSQRQVFA